MVKRNDGTSKEDVCQNQFTAYVVLAVKRKRQAYIKKKMRDKEKRTKTEEELSKFGIKDDDVWNGLEIQNEELVIVMQQLKPKEHFIVVGYAADGKWLASCAGFKCACHEWNNQCWILCQIFWRNNGAH